jgi:hypothetical protein
MIAVAAALRAGRVVGRDVIWLYTGAPRTRRQYGSPSALASIVWITSWRQTAAVSLGAFARIPVEVLVLVAVALVLPPRPRRIVAAIAGILVGLLAIDKILNIVFYLELNRAFNPVNDWVSIRPAEGVIRDAIGTTLTNIALAVVGIVLILLIAAITASTMHITTVAARHRRGAVRGLAALTAIWGLSAGLSLQLVPGSPGTGQRHRTPFRRARRPVHAPRPRVERHPAPTPGQPR